MSKTKKGEMGVGTLIIFIAMLLVAAIAAGVLIQTAGSLQEQSLSTGQQARSQISTNARVIEVSGSDGRNGNLTDFQQIIKLSPGSDPIKLSQVIFTFNTKDMTSTLKYRGKNSLCQKNNSNGYNTWNEELMPELENYKGRDTSEGLPKLINHLSTTRDTEVDLDDDGLTDYVWVCSLGSTICPYPYNETPACDHYMMFNLSSAGYVYVHIRNDNGTLVNLSETDSTSGMNITRLNIGSYGFISAYRTDADAASTISSNDNPAGGAYFRIFKNPIVLEEDYDDDGIDDEFAVNDTHAILLLGSGEEISVPLGVDITSGQFNISLSGSFQNSTGTTLAYYDINANMTKNNYLPENSITITPYRLGEGYFAVQYEALGTNHVAGNLQRGDVIKMCYESPRQITEDQLVRLNLIPKIGAPTLTQFVTPDVISTERVYLYP